MSNLILKVKTRESLGKKVGVLRRNNIIPAVVYGHNFKPQNLEVDQNNFKKIFYQAGTNTIIDLVIDEKTPVKSLIHDLQYDQIKDDVIHIDFYRIEETEKVKVEVILKFLGEAPAVKEKGGILIHNLNEIEIEALPKDLIHGVDVDLSTLKELNDLIRIKDLKIPSTVKVSNDLEEVVASISVPRKEEEITPVAEELKEGEGEVSDVKEGETKESEKDEKEGEIKSKKGE